MKEKYSIPVNFQDAHIGRKEYEKLYQESLKKPEEFWSKQAERIGWFKKWKTVSNSSFKSPVSIKWFEEGELNVSYNCIDRHLKNNAKKTALLWEPDDPNNKVKEISFQELHDNVCKFSNMMKGHGVKKGDRVTLYMPMIPEAIYAMLACTRLGAVHSIVFAGFSPDSLAGRINDCDSCFVITADENRRGGKIIDVKGNVDKALEHCPQVEKVFVVKNTGSKNTNYYKRDIIWNDLEASLDTHFEPEHMNAEDPLFVLYTSGSTGKPKGVLHTTGGYLVYASLTHEVVFDAKSDDIYWCTADIGWITGHTYMVYGPLANGVTTLIFEGVPSSPTPARMWEIVDRNKVSLLYTAPTAIRALMREGEKWVQKTSRKSLRLLGSVGEPINPEAWRWYYEEVGDSRCPIVDTWWQTETGGIMITPLPGATELKPGAASKPFFGIEPVILNEKGEELSGEAEGLLAIKQSWPGQMRTVYKNHERFESSYFSAFKGYYFSGDGCRRDKDGYYWITGRVDDVLNVSGHRLGTAEIESSLVGHDSVSEAAVVGYPHDVKGQGIYVYVTLVQGSAPSDELKKELIQKVRSDIGPIAKPDLLQWAPALPKTRSGKIMRRILRKIAENEPDKLGDTSTLADETVVRDLVDNRLNR